MIDGIGKDHHSAQNFIKYRRQKQQHVGHKIARKRLLENCQHTNTGFLSHHRPRDLYLTGESSQYANVAFLDGHDTVLAANIYGEVDVLRLPRYGDTNTTMTEVAGKLRLSNSSTYSVKARYKLKSLQNGDCFCIGSPSGELSIFATEHASTWCYDRLPYAWKRRVQQDDLSRNLNNQQTRSNQRPHWAPFITNQWQTNLQERRCFASQPVDFSHWSYDTDTDAGAQNWCIRPRDDALWDFMETPSSLLAVHAKQDELGCAKHVGVIDCRLSNGAETVASIDLVDKLRTNKTALPEGITALCFASQFALLTAHAQLHYDQGSLAQKVDNSIYLWDLRKTDKSVHVSPVISPAMTTDTQSTFDTRFVSYLTPSTSSGRVMITSSYTYSDNRTPASIQHYWYDLGTHETYGTRSYPIVKPYVQQHPFNPTLFATNPDQDILACYDGSGSNRNGIRLFDLNTPPEEEEDDQRQRQSTSRDACNTATIGTAQAQSMTPNSRKRSLEEQDTQTSAINSSSSKVSRSCSTTEDVSVSSSSSDDDSDDDGEDSDEDESDNDDPNSYWQQHRGVVCLGSFRPKLTDCHGLSTNLSCLAVNDSGTALVGGSIDGDIFVWRGS